MSIDVAARGNLMNRNVTYTFNFIDEMVVSQHQWTSEQGTTQATLGHLKTDALKKLVVQVEAMQKRFEQMNVSNVRQSSPYIIYSGMDHLSINCNWECQVKGMRSKRFA